MTYIVFIQDIPKNKNVQSCSLPGNKGKWGEKNDEKKYLQLQIRQTFSFPLFSTGSKFFNFKFCLHYFWEKQNKFPLNIYLCAFGKSWPESNKFKLRGKGLGELTLLC